MNYQTWVLCPVTPFFERRNRGRSPISPEMLERGAGAGGAAASAFGGASLGVLDLRG